MGKRTGKPRGRPRERAMPPDIDATPEDVAKALFGAPTMAAAMAVEPPEPEEEPENAPRRRGGDSNP